MIRSKPSVFNYATNREYVERSNQREIMRTDYPPNEKCIVVCNQELIEEIRSEIPVDIYTTDYKQFCVVPISKLHELSQSLFQTLSASVCVM